MTKKLQKILSAIVLGAMLLASTMSAFAASDADYEIVIDNTTTAHDLLGEPMTSYAVITNTFVLDGDAETSFAAKKVEVYNGQTGSDLTNIAEQTFMIGEIEGYYVDWSTNPPTNSLDTEGRVTLLLKGGFTENGYATHVIIPGSEESKIRFQNNDGNNRFATYDFTKEEINAKVQNLLDRGATVSSMLADLDATEGVEIVQNQYSGKYELNLTNRPDGLYVIKVTKDDFRNYFSEAAKLQLNVNPKQTLIFDVEGDGEFTIQQFTINGHVTDDWLNINRIETVVGKENAANRIIFNFKDAEVVQTAGSVVGTFFAPNADFIVNNTSAGHLVASMVEIKNGEWHNTCHSIQPIDEKPHNDKDVPTGTSVILEGTKVLTGRDMEAGEFSFSVLENGTSVASGTNTADGTIIFEEISYTEEGEHTYSVVEIEGDLDNVTYSTDSFEVKVSVTESNGALVKNVTYPEGGIVFENIYEEPEEPDEPDEPENPDEPDNPDEPENPDEPDNPEEPENPNTPETPKKPNTPNETVKKTAGAPNTADQADLAKWMSLFVASMAVMSMAAIQTKRHFQ